MTLNRNTTYSGVALTHIDEINNAERRLREKKIALEDMQNEYNLLERQALDTYKASVCCMFLDQRTTIDASRDWLSMVERGTDKDGNKLDKRKSYKEKDMYNWFVGQVNKCLGIEMENVSIVDHNFGMATMVIFDYMDNNWELTIPHVNAINIDNFRMYGSNCFKLKLGHKNNNITWECFGTTFEEDELADIMQEGITKYCNNGVRIVEL